MKISAAEIDKTLADWPRVKPAPAKPIENWYYLDEVLTLHQLGKWQGFDAAYAEMEIAATKRGTPYLILVCEYQVSEWRTQLDRTASHNAGAPTTIKGWVISEAEQKLLDEYGACFAEATDAPTNAATFCPHGTPHRYPCEKCDVQPSDAARLAEIVDEIAERFITGKVIEAGYKLHELAVALRAKDKP